MEVNYLVNICSSFYKYFLIVRLFFNTYDLVTKRRQRMKCFSQDQSMIPWFNERLKSALGTKFDTILHFATELFLINIWLRGRIWVFIKMSMYRRTPQEEYHFSFRASLVGNVCSNLYTNQCGIVLISNLHLNCIFFNHFNHCYVLNDLFDRIYYFITFLE